MQRLMLRLHIPVPQALRELRDRHLYARMEHEAVAARLQQLQQQLALQVRAYHQTLLGAMSSATESTRALVAPV